MSRIFYHAAGHGLWEEGKRSPASKAKLGKKHQKYERQIFSFDAARVLARLEEPNLLVIETCIATGVRISEVLGLKWRNVNLNAGTIKIERRVWHQDLDRPKSEDSRRVLGIGDFAERYRAKLAEDVVGSDTFVFQQKRAPGRPLWDSGVRDALHQGRRGGGTISPDLVRTPSAARTSPGGSRLGVARSRHPRSPATAFGNDRRMHDRYARTAKRLTRRIQAKTRRCWEET